MVLLDKLWDDVVAGPTPDRGLGKLRKIVTAKPLEIKDVEIGESSSKYQRSLSLPLTPGTPGTPSPTGVRKENVWRSVFHPGSNLATRGIGANVFDKPLHPNSPTVYDWLYSGETRSKHHR
ncbi:dormancy-associated protein homolog 1 [Impatiens glandulifera]|uniref:dormancy-associated protein homolog 1 n=1 Tax=Impatiens glandulifera TaxID=253017 RepID=UPI001FB0BCEB|nr:dormancy-associated protein homolog 1 [Impatiens glandulifera]